MSLAKGSTNILHIQMGVCVCVSRCATTRVRHSTHSNVPDTVWQVVDVVVRVVETPHTCIHTHTIHTHMYTSTRRIVMNNPCGYHLIRLFGRALIIIMDMRYAPLRDMTDNEIMPHARNA